MSCPGKVIKYIYFKIHVWTFLDFGNQSKRGWSRESCRFTSCRSAKVEASLATPLTRLVAQNGWGRGNKNGVGSYATTTPTITCLEKGVARASLLLLEGS